MSSQGPESHSKSHPPPTAARRRRQLGIFAILMVIAAVDRDDRLVSAIETLAKGGSALAPAITERILNKPTKTTDTSLATPDKLSKSELRVLNLIAAGYSNSEIAEALYKSEGTIRNQVSFIFIFSLCSHVTGLNVTLNYDENIKISDTLLAQTLFHTLLAHRIHTPQQITYGQ